MLLEKMVMLKIHCYSKSQTIIFSIDFWGYLRCCIDLDIFYLIHSFYPQETEFYKTGEIFLYAGV
jgi:hypothetical protein